MKYEKAIKINLGNYNMLELRVSEADNFDDCNDAIIEELKKHTMETTIDLVARKALYKRLESMEDAPDVC